MEETLTLPSPPNYLDAGTPVTQYLPNKSYTLRVRLTAGNGSPSRYGFQAVALTGTANSAAGTFGTAPTGFRKTTIVGRTYIEHNTPRTMNTMSGFSVEPLGDSWRRNSLFCSRFGSQQQQQYFRR